MSKKGMLMPGSDGVVSIAVVCEGSSDLRLIRDISDRVIAGRLGLTDPSGLISRREFRGAGPGRLFLAWADVKSVAKEMRIRFHGHFDQAGVRDPGKEDAHASRKALRVLKAAEKRPDAVLLVRDSDGSTERRKGMMQARDESG